MKKEGKKRGGKVVAGSATAVVLAVLAMFGGKAFGLGGGSGTGEDGNRNMVNKQSSVSKEQESDTTVNDEATTAMVEGTAIVIEVVKNKYLIDGEEKNLSEVELVIRRADSEKTTFILEDNYASAKAWDDVREIFINLELSVIEQ